MPALQSESINLTRSFGVDIRRRHASAKISRGKTFEFDSERVIGLGFVAASLGRADDAVLTVFGKPTSA